MCDYCGCRIDGPTAELHREHTELIDLRDRLWNGKVPPGDQGPTFDHLVDLLQRHAIKEEMGLFVHARELDGLAERVTALCAEHEALYRGLSGGLDGTGRDDAFTLLGTHIDDEEWDLFPHLMPVLAPEQWEEIELAHLAVDRVWAEPPAHGRNDSGPSGVA